jgi:hypothetical protein
VKIEWVNFSKQVLTMCSTIEQQEEVVNNCFLLVLCSGNPAVVSVLCLVKEVIVSYVCLLSWWFVKVCLDH